MTDGRKRITRVIAALGITTLGGSVLVSPSYAEPDIDSVEARVDKLYHEAEMASERYNEAREELEATQTRLSSLRADLERQQAKVESVREQVAAAVVSQYQGQALSTTSQVFLSEDPDAFLDQLATVSAYNDQQGEMMADFATQVKQLELREAAAKRELAEVAETKEQLAAEKAEIDEKAGAAEELLSELEAEAEAEAAAAARSQAASRSVDRAPAPAPDVAASGRAGAAVSYGPAAFDCSGLTMMAWAQAGVSLPHSSSGQMSSGTPVSSSELAPGDLVFYYSPVSHVGMYIGNGQIVHAANPSSGVEVVDVMSMPYSGAVRPG